MGLEILMKMFFDALILIYANKSVFCEISY